MIRKKIIAPVFLLAAVAMLSAGCVKEDTADCGTGLRPNFRCTLNNQDRDLFDSQVNDITVYIFDSRGVLYDIVEANASEFFNGKYKTLALDKGRYTLVAWASSGADISTSYMSVEMTDPAAHQYIPSPGIGTTTLANFQMMLVYRGIFDGSGGDVAPVSDTFDDLFYGGIQDLEVTGGNQTATINLIKDTHILKVRVTGLQYLEGGASPQAFAQPQPPATRAAQPVSVWALARNERYNSDNNIGEYARLVRYEPPYNYMDQTSMAVDIKTLRLDKVRHTADPILLHVRRNATGTDIVPPIDVVASIFQIKDQSGNNLYRTQEDLDRQYEYMIDIDIARDLSAKVSVNGWRIEDVEPNIGRD